MTEKSRATRWRNTLVAKGGKPVGVTLTPAAAAALEAIQFRYAVSQREAISRALEFAAARMGQEAAGDGFSPDTGREVEKGQMLSRLEDMERRLAVVEARVIDFRVDAPPDFELEQAAADAVTGLDPSITGEAAERLVEFSARYMWELGERVARTKLYELARHDGVSIHDSLHAYSAFVSLNMDRIRERMRTFK